MNDRTDDLELQIQETRKAEVAYKWLAKKLSGPSKYVACEANAALLASYIDEYCDGIWTEGHLEEAYDNLKGQLVHSSERTLQPSAPQRTQVVPTITVIELAPDGQPYPQQPAGCDWPKSRKAIFGLPGETYKSLYHSKRYGPEFRAYVNEILRRNF